MRGLCCPVCPLLPCLPAPALISCPVSVPPPPSQYFEGIPGVRPCPADLNPATWMLEVSALGAEQKLRINFADVYDASDVSK